MSSPDVTGTLPIPGPCETAGGMWINCAEEKLAAPSTVRRTKVSKPALSITSLLLRKIQTRSAKHRKAGPDSGIMARMRRTDNEIPPLGRGFLMSIAGRKNPDSLPCSKVRANRAHTCGPGGRVTFSEDPSPARGDRDSGHDTHGAVRGARDARPRNSRGRDRGAGRGCRQRQAPAQHSLPPTREFQQSRVS